MHLMAAETILGNRPGGCQCYLNGVEQLSKDVSSLPSHLGTHYASRGHPVLVCSVCLSLSLLVPHTLVSGVPLQ